MTLKVFVHDEDIVAYFDEEDFPDLSEEYRGRMTISGFTGTNFTGIDPLKASLYLVGNGALVEEPTEDRSKIFSALSEELFGRIKAGEFAQEMWEHRVRSVKSDVEDYREHIAKTEDLLKSLHEGLREEQSKLEELKSSVHRNPEYDVDTLPTYL